MNRFLSSFPRVLIDQWTGKNLLWNILAIVFTYLIVKSGLDWYYFTHTRNAELLSLSRPAIMLGALFPLLVPITLIVSGHLMKSKTLLMAGWAVGQAALAGSLISSFYKVFTGRIQPNLHDLTTNITTDFNFGFWHHGIFWGWPSSHTTIAFAMAFALVGLFPKNRTLKFAVILYALYIGIGVSFSIHWFSDFIAGAIMGIIIGLNVSRNFKPEVKNRNL